MKQKLLNLRALLMVLMMAVGFGHAFAEVVTYTVTSTSAVEQSGEAPEGASASYSSTYNTKYQLTSGKSMTLTLSGFEGKTVTAISMSMRSNSSKGAGYLSVTAGSTTLATIGASNSGIKFNDAAWHGSWSTSYVAVTPAMENTTYEIGAGEDLVILLGATENSMYCESFTITYENGQGGQTKTLEAISVKTAPTKTAYTEGETFDPAGLVITKTYDNQETEDVEYDGNEGLFSFEPSLTTPLTDQTSVEITLAGKTVSQEITVTPFEAQAGTYTIDLNNILYGVSTGNNPTEQTTSKYGVKVVSGCLSTASSKTYYDAAHIRYYKDSYLKLTAPDGFVITSVVFTSAGTWNGSITSDPEGYDNGEKTWTGNSATVDFDFAAQNRIASMNVTYAEASVVKNPTEIVVTGTPDEFWKGDVFNRNGITVTAKYEDEDDADVTAVATFSGYDMNVAGEQTVTVTYGEKEATYNINVLTIANTAETAYTTAEAIAIIGAGKDLNSEVYVKGTVSSVDSYSDKYYSITYWLDDNTFEVYSGKGIDGADFESENDIKVGAQVVVKGKIKDYQGTPEFDKNNELVSYQVPTPTTANMKITAAQWGTFWAPFAVEIPEGVKAYTGEMKGDWIKMTEVEGVIPANTGVVVTSENVVDEDLQAAESNPAELQTCYTGNTTGAVMNVEQGAYLLQKQDEQVGWYKVSGEGFTLAPNRCYLAKGTVPEAVAESRTFIGFEPVDGDATGISTIASQAATKADGKYMVKGQIVVVKSGKAYNVNGTQIK